MGPRKAMQSYGILKLKNFLKKESILKKEARN